MLRASFLVLAALALGLLGLSGTGAEARGGGGGYHGGGGHHGGYHRPNYNRPHYNHRPNYWNYGYHGPRCRSWSNSCRFYYGGWYYNSPWWTVPVVGAGVVALANGAGSRHRAWCAGRYKTYNAQTNTYVSSSGKRKQCNSPYD